MDSFNLTTAVTKASTETLSFKSPVFFKRKFNVFNLPSRSAHDSNTVLAGSPLSKT